MEVIPTRTIYPLNWTHTTSSLTLKRKIQPLALALMTIWTSTQAKVLILMQWGSRGKLLMSIQIILIKITMDTLLGPTIKALRIPLKWTNTSQRNSCIGHLERIRATLKDIILLLSHLNLRGLTQHKISSHTQILIPTPKVQSNLAGLPP